MAAPQKAAKRATGNPDRNAAGRQHSEALLLRIETLKAGIDHLRASAQHQASQHAITAESSCHDTAAAAAAASGSLALEDSTEHEQERPAAMERLSAAEAELEELVQAPVAANEDPTLWLPDELLVLILLAVVHTRQCAVVCRRWRRLAHEPAVQRQLRTVLWLEYERQELAPKKVEATFGANLAASGERLVCTGFSLLLAWRAAHPNRRFRLEGHAARVTAVAVGEDGTIYSGSLDRTVRVWSGDDGTLQQQLEGHRDVVSALTLADGVVFGGSLDATIRVWSTRTWEHVETLVGHASGIYALTVVGDDVLCSASGDTIIQVWCIPTRARLRALTGHTRAVLALCAGRRNELVSGSHDKTVRVWCPTTGTQLRLLAGHASNVCCVAVLLDGTVFSGSTDRTIRVWRDRTTGAGDVGAVEQVQRPTHTLHVNGNTIALALSVDGTLYSAHGTDTPIHAW